MDEARAEFEHMLQLSSNSYRRGNKSPAMEIYDQVLHRYPDFSQWSKSGGLGFAVSGKEGSSGQLPWQRHGFARVGIVYK